jgi:O-antigen/teichoic acid export membrane protein
LTVSNNEKSSVRESVIIRGLIRGGGFAFLGKLITYPLGLILTMVFARLLSTADVGGYFLAMSLIMLGSSLVQAGLATTMNKVIARSLTHNNHLAARKTISIGIMALLIASIIAALLLTNEPGKWLLSQLDDGDYLLTGLTWIAAMVVIFAGVNYCSEILRGFHDLPSAALLDQQLLQRLLLFIILLVPLALKQMLTLVQILQMATAAAFIALLMGIILISPKIKQLGRHGESIPAKKVLAEAPTFLLVRINTWILNSAAIWVLGFARPLEEAALYGAGNTVALLVLAAWQVVSSAIGPTVVTLHAEGRSSALESILRSAAAVAALPGLVLAAILYFFGDSVLIILFTPEYAGAVGVLVVLALGRSISAFLGSPMMLLSMTHHQDIVLRILVVASALTLAGYAWVVGPYGAIGVAAISAISVVVQALLLSIVARRVLGLNTLPNMSVSGWRNFFKRFI